MLALDSLIYFAIGCFFEVCIGLGNFYLTKRFSGRLTRL